MMMRKKLLGGAIAGLVLSFPMVGHAEDEAELDAAPVGPTSPSAMTPSINPDSSIIHEGGAPGTQYASPSAGTGPSTTYLTGALYEPDGEADRAERERRGPNRVMLINGVAIFLGTYAVSAVAGGLSDTKGDEKLFIPLVGPWLDLAERECSFGECTFREDVNIAHVIGSGVAQAAGLGLVLGSFLLGEREPERERRGAKVHVLPMGMGRGGGGVGAFGTF
jgi:hypothetical protein